MTPQTPPEARGSAFCPSSQKRPCVTCGQRSQSAKPILAVVLWSAFKTAFRRAALVWTTRSFMLARSEVDSGKLVGPSSVHSSRVQASVVASKNWAYPTRMTMPFGFIFVSSASSSAWMLASK